jgi:hypothetical protein
VTPLQEDLAELVRELTETDLPVSFVDALRVVRVTRRAGDLPDELVYALVALHDAAHLTDGGREVLADYLRAVAVKAQQERNLAARVIKLSDSGKTARAKAGSTLRITTGGSDWEVTTLRGPATVTGRTDFELHLNGPGRVYVELTGQRRTFILRVVVE